MLMTMGYAGYFWGDAETRGTPEPTIEPSWHEFETPGGAVSCLGQSDSLIDYDIGKNCVQL